MKTATREFTSRTADKFVIRLPDGMRDHIAEVARKHHRSMNSEIIARLEQSLHDLPVLPVGLSIRNISQIDEQQLSVPERELLNRFREMSHRQQNALLALLSQEQAS
ncbi:MAG: Arc family DNA-binding protein [Halopseudomonas yangmingensis]|uniref:Arc-like DNA binding domain-containing protein n=1 Tax=Halopseudomonas yangmingensis TaxID=1720063 RepID=A0A1I4NL76_9GAMM|nr:Arc family DNA-binding protein [Halopseudomonas yangmingensis]SFM16201.1 Arc-like DNA binding domain-containing protein [Halopseudomonas yangmingensis]